MLDFERRMRRRDEIERTLEQVRSWPTKDQVVLIEGLLTPKTRLRLLVEEARRQVRVKDEREIDRAVNRAVRRVRRARAARR